MVQHVDQQHDVDAVVSVRNAPTVKVANRESETLTNQHIQTLDLDVGAQLEKTAGQRPIAGTDIKNTCPVGKELRHGVSETAHTTAMNELLVEDPDHARLMPRMLTKPLDRMV